MGSRKVIINLWKGRTVYAIVTVADPENSGSFRLFLCMATPEMLSVEPEKQTDEKIRMNIIIDSLRQSIETIKEDLPLKKAFQELMRQYGYLKENIINSAKFSDA